MGLLAKPTRRLQLFKEVSYLFDTESAPSLGRDCEVSLAGVRFSGQNAARPGSLGVLWRTSPSEGQLPMVCRVRRVEGREGTHLIACQPVRTSESYVRYVLGLSSIAVAGEVLHERRSEPRFSFRGDVRYMTVGGDYVPVVGEGVDISGRGISWFGALALGIGTRAVVWCRFDSGMEWLPIVGEVRSCVKQDDGFFRLGASVLDVKDPLSD